MTIEIDWVAFLQVFAAAFTAAIVVVGFYAVALRLLVRAGKVPVVVPAEFTDAITIVSEKDIRRANKAAAKSARKNPLTDGQRRIALVGAYGCFGVCGLAVLGGLLLILFNH
ncbi:peptidase [Microbacterium caowuchunii]|uniref:peptidase n=1 Tax=Microbacterium caowuchunii TaxID=2614638 RepID=UPI00124858C9|nr:peptidase [Microbacterium caowuchunii]QEW00470.1 peptidase [Microbacterium caowuchunii]